MTRIEFYILFGASLEDKLAYGHRLALQSLARGKSVHIHTGRSADTRALVRCFENVKNADHLTIDHRGEPEADPDVLINLSAEVPYFFSRFETTLEVVLDETQARAMARERYRYYQERGYLISHREVQPELV